jgi:hypothetical protein
MTDDRELRRRLKDADPAAGVELSPLERARMRATIAEAASARRTDGIRPAALWMGAAGVLAVVLLLVVSRGRAPHGREAATAPSLDDARTAGVASAPTDPPPLLEPAATPMPHVNAASHRGRRLRTTPDDGVPTTRIVFTAPEGTRIFWFGSETPAKEDAT